MKNYAKFYETIFNRVNEKCSDLDKTKYSEIASFLTVGGCYSVTESFVGQLMRNEKKFNIMHLFLIAVALNCSVDDFLPERKFENDEEKQKFLEDLFSEE